MEQFFIKIRILELNLFIKNCENFRKLSLQLYLFPSFYEFKTQILIVKLTGN
jgi:hypothetical protein